MKNNNFKYLFLGAATLLTVFSPVHARLTSLSAIQTTNVDGQSQQYINVTCATRSNKPKLVRDAVNKQWCDSVVDDICSKDKVKAAKQVCSVSYKNRLSSATKARSTKTVTTEVASTKPIPTKSIPTKPKATKPLPTKPKATVAKGQSETKQAAEIENLKKEALEIEDALLKIQATRLTLRKQELELLRQNPANAPLN